MEACEHHLEAVRNWCKIEDVPAMRRFLGNFTWVRGHFPREYVLALPALTTQLKKGAEWPMPDAGEKAKQALQQLAIRAMKLCSLDEVAAITRERPLCRLADCSGYGWGCTSYQISADLKKLNVLGQYSGLLTVAQSRWPARKGEMFAQREGTRASRRHLGRIPGDNYTDHSHLIVDMVAPEADPATMRWVADIISDGTRMRNLGGRSATMADGLSRMDTLHAELLRKEVKQLRNMTVNDLICQEEEDGDEHPWAIASHSRISETLKPAPSVEEPRDVAPAVEAAIQAVVQQIAPPKRVTVLVLPDNCSLAKREVDMAAAGRMLRHSVPNVQFHLLAAMPPVPDGRGGDLWMEPFFPADSPKALKSIRRDVNTGITATLRQCVAASPTVLLGFGQGATIALACARPRVVEAALAVSTVQPDEAEELRPAWCGIRAVIAIRPATLKVSSWAQLDAAMPCLRDPEVGYEPRPPQVIVRVEHSQLLFERELAAGMQVPRVDLVGDALTLSLIHI